MKKRGLTLIEVVVAMAILGMLLLLFFTFMSGSVKNTNELNALNNKHFDITNKLYNIDMLDDDPTDGQATNITDQALKNIVDIKASKTTINGLEIPYELFVANVDTDLESYENIGYNFTTIEYEEDGEGGLGNDILYNPNLKVLSPDNPGVFSYRNSVPVDYDPNNEVFPKDTYFINNEPYGNPLAEPQELGLYYRMDRDNVPQLDESHKNYLLEKGNSITVETYPHIGTTNLKYTQYFPETSVNSYLEQLSSQDPNNKWQVVYFKAPAVTYAGHNRSIAPVVMDTYSYRNSQQIRNYTFDLSTYFPNNSETHLVFIADGQFEWSYYNAYAHNTANYSDEYNFKVNGGHVYFISLSGKHMSSADTTADISDKFTVVPNVDGSMGQVTVANTQLGVGEERRSGLEYYNYTTNGMLDILEVSKMENVFLYYPFQDVYFKSFNVYGANQPALDLKGGVVARSIRFASRYNYGLTKPGDAGNKHKVAFAQWNGDPKILGYGIDDY